MQLIDGYLLVVMTGAWLSSGCCADSTEEMSIPGEINGILVGQASPKGIEVGLVKEMGAAGRIVRQELKTGRVERFRMREFSNVNMEFFKELEVCESVQSVVLMNIEANKIDLTKVPKLFPKAARVRIYLGGKFDADFSGLKACRDLIIRGTISPGAVESLVGLEGLEFASFSVDERTQYVALEKLANLKNLETLDVYPAEGFEIPKEWLEKLDANPKMRQKIDPYRCGWKLREPE